MKKISTTTAKNFVKEQLGDQQIVKSYATGDSTFDVTFRTSLTCGEKGVFINRVMDGCHDAEGNYLPEYYEPMLHATMLQMCTNLPVLALKGEKGEGGESLMDLDAMESLWTAVYDWHSKEDTEFCRLYWKMGDLCADAIHMREQEKQTAQADAIRSFNNVMVALTDLIGDLAEKMESIDMTDVITKVIMGASDSAGEMDAGTVLQLLNAEK